MQRRPTPLHRWRRFATPWLLAATVLAAGCATVRDDGGWVGTWATAPTGPESLQAAADFVPQITFDNQTLRFVVRSSIAGSQVRVRLSNEIGDAPAPLKVGAARIALRGTGHAVVAGTDRALTFGGQASVTIPPKGAVLSDPVTLDVPALTDLSISLYLPERTVARTLHFVTRQTQGSAPGNHVAAATLPADAKAIPQWFVVSGVDVIPKQAGASALVAFGDSITDGFGQNTLRTDGGPWTPWPSRLADRLQAHPALSKLGVLNLGISGNRVLNDAAQTTPPTPAGGVSLSVFGERATKRFDRDVAKQSGASCVLVLEGINDIGQGPARGQVVTVDALKAGHQQLVAQARAAKLKVIGGTLMPFQGYAAPYYSEENEAKRQAMNAWIRSGAAGYDAVIDFDAIVRDPANPLRLRAALDSGDHLHPNDAGYQAMADGIDLGVIERHCLRGR